MNDLVSHSEKRVLSLQFLRAYLFLSPTTVMPLYYPSEKMGAVGLSLTQRGETEWNEADKTKIKWDKKRGGRETSTRPRSKNSEKTNS